MWQLSLRTASLFLVTVLLGTLSVAAEEFQTPPPVRCLEFSPDGRLLVGSAADQFARGELVVWQVDTWKPRFRHQEPVGFPRVAFSPDGKQLALSRFAPETKLFDVETGQLTQELQGHTDHARCVTFTPDGKRIITGSYDLAVKIWNAASGDELATLEGYTSPVYHVAVSPDGSLLAAADGRGSAVHLWDLKTNTKLHVFGNLGSFVPHVTFSPDGSLLAVASWTGGLTLFDTKTYQPQRRIHRIAGVHWSAFSADNHWLAVVTNGTTVYVFPIDTSTDAKLNEEIADLLAKLEDDSYEVREQATERLAAIGPAAVGRLVNAADSPSAEVRWRTRMLRQRMSRPESATQITGHLDQLECVCFSPDGTLLASGDNTGHVKVWRVGTWEQVVSLAVKVKDEQ